MDSTLVMKNSYTYCKNLQVIKNKGLHACSQGDRLVGKDHRSSPTATHKEDNQRNTSCFKFVTQCLPYVHATGLANFNTSIFQIHNYSTSMTLISPSSYLKTIIKNQTSHSIQCTLYESFYYIPLGCPSYQDQFHNQRKPPCCSKDSQNNISEAREFIYFFKINHCRALKGYK